LSAVQLQRLFELQPGFLNGFENLLLEFIAGVMFFKFQQQVFDAKSYGQAADDSAEGCADGGSNARKDGTDSRAAGCACRSAAENAGGFACGDFDQRFGPETDRAFGDDLAGDLACDC